jgi:hypothetical protein
VEIENVTATMNCLLAIACRLHNAR